MADLTGFRQMLADRAEADKGLPKVCLKCTTDLDLALARLITVDSRSEDETDGQVAARYLDEICAELSKPENEDVVKHINAVIAAFKEKISAATSALGDIKNAANQLAGYMETYKNDALARDPFVSTHANFTKLSVDYPTWDWSGPAIVGTPTYIKERVGAMWLRMLRFLPSTTTGFSSLVCPISHARSISSRLSSVKSIARRSSIRLST